MHQGELFGVGDYAKYQLKDIEHFYIKREAAKLFSELMTRDLLAFARLNQLTTESDFKVTLGFAETIHDLINDIGVTPEVQAAAQASVDLNLRLFSSRPELKSLLDLFFKSANGGSYIVSHSVAVGHLACAISAKLGWNSPITFQKLTMAALLHDVTFSSHLIKNVQELEEHTGVAVDKLSPQERSFYRLHPIQAASVAREFTDLPPGVDAIIERHHERPDGSGFPNQCDHSMIPPLASVFIVAHMLFSYALQHPGEPECLKKFLSELPGSYWVGEFKKMLVALTK